MNKSEDRNRKLYVGMLDGVCAVTSSDGGGTWEKGKTTPVANAAARLSASPMLHHRAYLAAYEAGVRDGVVGRPERPLADQRRF